MVAGRSLRPLDCLMDEAVDEKVPEAGLVDPPDPVSLDYFVAE